MGASACQQGQDCKAMAAQGQMFDWDGVEVGTQAHDMRVTNYVTDHPPIQPLAKIILPLSAAHIHLVSILQFKPTAVSIWDVVLTSDKKVRGSNITRRHMSDSKCPTRVAQHTSVSLNRATLRIVQNATDQLGEVLRSVITGNLDKDMRVTVFPDVSGIDFLDAYKAQAEDSPDASKAAAMIAPPLVTWL